MSTPSPSATTTTTYNVLLYTVFSNVQQEALARVTALSLPNVTLHVETADLTQPQRLIAQLEACDILFGEPVHFSAHMKHAHRLKWIQLVMAGVDKAIASWTDIHTLPYAVTRAAGGSFGPHMAEWVIGEMIAFERHFAFWFQEQAAHRWKSTKPYSIRALHGLRVGIMGATGSIGLHIARACRFFGMKCRGLSSKTPLEAAKFVKPMQAQMSSASAATPALPFVDEWFQTTPSADANSPILVPKEFLHDVDYLINIFPSTASTRGCLNGDVLQACRRSTDGPATTIFMNLGRGDVISDSSLLRALLGSDHEQLIASGTLPSDESSDRYLRAVISDVFNLEPLPKDHAFYTLPPALFTITPHVSGMSSAASSQIVDVFIENLHRFVNGGETTLLHLVDKKKGY